MTSDLKFVDAAFYYEDLDHQNKAWNYLQSNVDSKVLREFTDLYRSETRTQEADVDLISKSDLAYIWNCAESLIGDHEIYEMNQCLHRFDITTTSRMRHFLSQTAHESGGGKWKEELSDGLYLRGRADLGHGMHEGEVWKGAGYIQLTGKYNYQRFADWMGDPDIMKGSSYVAVTWPFTSAGFWWMDNKMNDLCDTNPSVYTVTLRVNGGTNGLSDREYYYDRCTKVIP